MDELEDVIRQLGQKAQRNIEHHPDPEVLVDYIDNLLVEADMNRVREHLAICKHCTDGLLRLQEGVLLAKAPTPSPESSSSPENFWRSYKVAWAHAAIILVVCGAIFSWAMIQRERLKRLEQPNIAQLIELTNLSDGSEKGSPVGENVTPVLGDGSLSLLLDMGTVSDSGPFFLNLRLDSKVVWKKKIEKLGLDGFLCITLPNSIQAGHYVIELQNESKKNVATFACQIKGEK